VVLFDFASTFEAMLDDLQEQVPVAAIAQRFHNTMVTCVLQAAQLVYNVYGITTVTLSGGVFLNRYLMERCLSRLVELGYTVAVNRDLPPSDASLSYGQAVLACNELEEE
jgi:hydrogenase maturation protein HypF